MRDAWLTIGCDVEQIQDASPVTIHHPNIQRVDTGGMDSDQNVHGRTNGWQSSFFTFEFLFDPNFTWIVERVANLPSVHRLMPKMTEPRRL